MASIICRWPVAGRRFSAPALPRRADPRILPPMSARIALIAPFASPSIRGNAVTIARIERGLAARGIVVRVWDRSARGDEAIEAEVEAFVPSLVHAFHAWNVGPLALRLARRMELPLVVTLTGTDANHDLFDPERAAVVRRVLEGAARVVVFDDSIGVRVASVLPDVRPRIVRVPQASETPAGAGSVAAGG